MSTDTTPHLGISLLATNQAQKEVTINEGLYCIDALMNGGAISKSTATPPGSPSAGDLYIVGSSATGSWLGKDGRITYFDQVWRFIIPREGMTLWVADLQQHYVYRSGSWQALPLGTVSAFTARGTTSSVNSAPAKLAFNNEILDRLSEYDPTTNYRFTAGAAGTYFIAAMVTVPATASNNYAIYLYKNGSSYLSYSINVPATANAQPLSLSTVIQLSAGDYLEVYGSQDSGSARNYTLVAFTGHRIGS